MPLNDPGPSVSGTALGLAPDVLRASTASALQDRNARLMEEEAAKAAAANAYPFYPDRQRPSAVGPRGEPSNLMSPYTGLGNNVVIGADGQPQIEVTPLAITPGNIPMFPTGSI